MQALFFDAADKVLFLRDDDEQASWQVEEFSLRLLYPYDAGKIITRGMRVGFADPDGGGYQVFEIRSVKTYEPDHYQEISAEHIVVSELTDEHMEKIEVENKTAGQALTAILNGTLWALGTSSSSGTMEYLELSMGSVWQNVHSIIENWNVYIMPRVTVANGAISGRFLDITDAGGVWHGLRLSLDKNSDEMGVVYDDTDVITAMYGYGKNTDDDPLTFSSVTWTATADHPAKPSGQKYIEDPAATALYGRNGRPRFGYYANSSIDNATTLLEKTWESLKTTNAPKVTIDCMVRDLYRLGYADQPIRLHDTAIVEIRPIGVTLTLEIIKLSVDLNDPTATRPVIGAYIPNIIYVQKVVSSMAAGGGGGGGSAASSVKGRSGGRGGSNGRGQTKGQQEVTEFETEIAANQYQISLRAYQRDLNDTNAQVLLNEAAITINANAITQEVTDRTNADNTLSSTITQTASSIRAEVADKVDKSSVTITSTSITVDTKTFAITANTVVTLLDAQTITVDGIIANAGSISSFACGTLGVNSASAGWHNVSVASGISGQVLAGGDISLAHSHSITMTESSGTVTATIGGAQSSNGSDSFDIADTQFYKDAIVAAKADGASEGYSIGFSAGKDEIQNNTTIYIGNFYGGSAYVAARYDGSSFASDTVYMPSSATFSVTVDGPSGTSGTYSVSCTAGGKTYGPSTGSWSS